MFNFVLFPQHTQITLSGPPAKPLCVFFLVLIIWQFQVGITLLLYYLHSMFMAVGLPNFLIKEAEEVQESTGSSASKLRWDDTRVNFQMIFPVCVRVGQLPHYCAAAEGAGLCRLWHDMWGQLLSHQSFILVIAILFAAYSWEKKMTCCHFTINSADQPHEWKIIYYFTATTCVCGQISSFQPQFL